MSSSSYFVLPFEMNRLLVDQQSGGMCTSVVKVSTDTQLCIPPHPLCSPTPQPIKCQVSTTQRNNLFSPQKI